MCLLHHRCQLGVETPLPSSCKKTQEIYVESYPTRPWLQNHDVSAETGGKWVISRVRQRAVTLDLMILNTQLNSCQFMFMEVRTLPLSLDP